MEAFTIPHFSRRGFIKIAAAVGGGVVFGFRLPADNETAAGAVPGPSFEPEFYLRIDPDNTVTFGLLKQEIGQGIETGLPMVLADELGADWETLRVEPVVFDRNLPGYRDRFGMMETGGSTSVLTNWLELRRAGAGARETLLLAAAREWGVEATECRAVNSRIFHDASGRSETFGHFATAAAALSPPAAPRLKRSDEFTLIGRPVHTRKNRRVVEGREPFGLDVRVPGMVYAAIARSPVVGGRVIRFDDRAARALPGVIAVVKVDGHRSSTPHWRFEEGVAVVAKSTWAAFNGRQALAITWDEGTNSGATDEAQRAQLEQATDADLVPGMVVGDVDSAFAGAAMVLEATYEVPFLGHNLMEPLNAVVQASDAACEVWAGSQSPQYTSVYLAELLNIPLEAIRFHPQSSGGGFGRRFFGDFVAEAAIVSRQVGRPVMSVWSREDEVRHGHYHPMSREHYRVAIDAAGRWVGMDYTGVTTFFRGAASSPFYPIPHLRERSRQVEPIVNVGAWRSVGEHPMCFGKESLVDEMARAVDADPFDYRIRLLNETLGEPPEGVGYAGMWRRNAELQPRLLRMLEILRERSRWDERGERGRHCGLAIGDFHGSSVCGQVAEVVSGSAGFRVTQVTCVLECGVVINPQLVRAQVEGSIAWALNAVVYGGVTVRDGRVQQSNFHDSPLLRLPEMPEIDILLLESDLPPGKVGEAAVPPLAPAVANAVFAATGRRVRGFPFSRYL